MGWVCFTREGAVYGHSITCCAPGRGGNRNAKHCEGGGVIIRPEILPDEYAPGYKGRVMALNGLIDGKHAMSVLMAWSGNAAANLRDFSTVEVLAKIAGIDNHQFVRAHTTLPLRRAVAAIHREVEHGSTSQRSILWSVALRELRPGAYLCKQCILEDLDFHGISYWRREHQMPGLYCCSKHSLPLAYVDSQSAFGSPPSAFFACNHLVDPHWVKKLERSDAVQRFLSITSDLLARPMPLDERYVSRAAIERATALGLHTGRGAVRQKLVSDLIIECFDREWLDSVAPSLIGKPIGEFKSTVDGTLLGKRKGLSATTYALVFAALFESSDLAINAMLKRSSHTSVGRKLLPSSAGTTEKELREAYIESRGHHSAVAHQLGLSPLVAKRRLRELGLPNMSSTTSQQVRNALAAVVDSRLSLEAAGKAFDVDRLELERLLIQSASSFRSTLMEMRRSEQHRTLPPRPKPSAPPRQRTVQTLEVATVS